MGTAGRARIVRAFGELTDEAFYYVCNVLWRAARDSRGMRADSRATIGTLGDLALRHLQLPPPPSHSED